ncbi:MAG: class I SAM-dependent methyltransferase [Bacteroidota bacterium]|nr:class I SAM-dependent methyltransferase [Bacteroidota bacterium]
MIREIRTGSDISIFDEEYTKGLGKLLFHHPVGTFSLTPASKIIIDAVIRNQDHIKGIGLDWGSGTGCLAILAARINSVKKVYGLEISEDNIKISKKNAEENGVSQKVQFILSDSYTPFKIEDREELDKLRKKVNFILSNPPSSDWDDGFGFRRIVLEGAKEYLSDNGIVFLNISFQYGKKRVESLCENIDGFTYMGLAASTEWVQFDLNRPDLLDCLKVYSQEEMNGGIEYSFFNDSSDSYINAQSALNYFHKSGKSPLTKWQTHMFKYNIL